MKSHATLREAGEPETAATTMKPGWAAIQQVPETEIPITLSYADGVFSLQLADSAKRLKLDPDVYRLRWTLSADSSVPAGTEYGFDRPGITFFGENAPYIRLANPDLTIAAVRADAPLPTSWEMLWGNLTAADKNAFFYRIRVVANGIPVNHDPTVENQPPLQP
jgi:hypothetical protein